MLKANKKAKVDYIDLTLQDNIQDNNNFIQQQNNLVFINNYTNKIFDNILENEQQIKTLITDYLIKNNKYYITNSYQINYLTNEQFIKNINNSLSNIKANISELYKIFNKMNNNIIQDINYNNIIQDINFNNIYYILRSNEKIKNTKNTKTTINSLSNKNLICNKCFNNTNQKEGLNLFYILNVNDFMNVYSNKINYIINKNNNATDSNNKLILNNKNIFKQLLEDDIKIKEFLNNFKRFKCFKCIYANIESNINNNNTNNNNTNNFKNHNENLNKLLQNNFC